MRRLARRQRAFRGHAPTERPPQLVLRFAVLTALCLGVAAAAILVLTRHVNTVEAEKNAARHARFVVDAVLSEELRATDLTHQVGRSRRAELDRLFRKNVLVSGTMLVAVSRPDRTVTYSTDHSLIGRRLADPGRAQDALNGTITSEVTRIADPAVPGKQMKALQSYVPVSTPGGGTGVAAIYQDYGPIEASVRSAFLPIAGILEVVLLLLYVLLVPLLARVTRRMGRQIERIEHQAYHDDLTDLPNRLLFRERIAQALEAARGAGGAGAVLLLDIDRFKEINDTLGHSSGDDVLRQVAGRLGEAFHGEVTLARIGGDEFGMVLPGHDAAVAGAVADEVRRLLWQPFTLQGLPLPLAASIGISLYPEHGEDADTLMRRADVAMYVAKETRGGYTVYDPEQDTNDARRLALAGELPRALDERELVLHYQPKLDLASGAIVGAETLVRWLHPEHGLIGPAEFIPIAERTGMITRISGYVLEGAIRQCSDWNAAGLDVSVALNLTMHDLLDLDLPERIGGLLADAGLRPRKLVLEITESTIMGDPLRVREVLTRLNALGIRLAIDDFGTGYSSLGYLKNLPVDELKIDRSFVQEMTSDSSDATIVRSTVDLGHNLGLRVVAEGVESEDVLETLRSLGCDEAQGYFIGRPVAAEELTSRLSSAPEPRASARVRARLHPLADRARAGGR